MGRSHRELSAAAREEAEARFSQLYEENWNDLLNYALRRATTPEDAADLVAETFLVAWRRLANVPPGARTRLWLFGVARRLIANQRRGEFRRDRLTDRLRGELATAVVDEAPSDRIDPVISALDRLGEKDREVLLLAGAEELQPAQIATVRVSPLWPPGPACIGRGADSCKSSRPVRHPHREQSPNGSWSTYEEDG
jgi:RNA polymerase sigma factor (sigma-70 family)